MKTITRTFDYCLFILILFASTVLSQVLPLTTPRTAGLSEARLAEITSLMQDQVDDEKLAGAVAVVARRGKIAYMKSIGKQDIEADIDMNTETIFRIPTWYVFSRLISSPIPINDNRDEAATHR